MPQGEEGRNFPKRPARWKKTVDRRGILVTAVGLGGKIVFGDVDERFT